MRIENKPKKSLGQNFLIDKNIINKIVKIGNIDQNLGGGFHDIFLRPAEISHEAVIRGNIVQGYPLTGWRGRRTFRTVVTQLFPRLF